MTEAEKEVRGAWRDIRLLESNAGLGYTVQAEMCTKSGVSDWKIIGQDDIYGELAWQAALAFTRERQEQVRLLDEEIAWLNRVGNEGFNAKKDLFTWQRILSRLQETRKTLTQGMSGKEREEC